MVFIGSELAYDVQARDHDWMDEHAKAASERKRKQPIFVVLSRLLRPLRPNTNGRMLSQTLRWRREGKLVDFGCGDAGFLVLATKHFDVTGIELSPRGAEISRQRISPEKILEGPVTGACRHAARRVLRCGDAVRLYRTRMAAHRGTSRRASRSQARRRHRDQDSQLRKLEPHDPGNGLVRISRSRAL